MAKYSVEPLVAVGLEGAFGLISILAAMPLLYLGKDRSVWLDLPRGWNQMVNTPSVAWSAAIIALSIGFFNFFGLSVTRSVSGPFLSLTHTVIRFCLLTRRHGQRRRGARSTRAARWASGSSASGSAGRHSSGRFRRSRSSASASSSTAPYVPHLFPLPRLPNRNPIFSSLCSTTSFLRPRSSFPPTNLQMTPPLPRRRRRCSTAATTRTRSSRGTSARRPTCRASWAGVASTWCPRRRGGSKHWQPIGFATNSRTLDLAAAGRTMYHTVMIVDFWLWGSRLPLGDYGTFTGGFAIGRTHRDREFTAATRRLSCVTEHYSDTLAAFLVPCLGVRVQMHRVASSSCSGEVDRGLSRTLF